MQTFRQGDVLLVRIDQLPSNAAPAPRERGRIILAKGEAHGHAHAIRNADASAFRMESAEGDLSNRALVDFVVVGGGGADLNHELRNGAKADHEPVSLEPGVYRVVRQREYVAPQISTQVWD